MLNNFLSCHFVIVYVYLPVVLIFQVLLLFIHQPTKLSVYYNIDFVVVCVLMKENQQLIFSIVEIWFLGSYYLVNLPLKKLWFYFLYISATSHNLLQSTDFHK